VYDHPAIPTVLDATGNDLVHIGRIRRDDSVENGLQLWVVSDNIRKGAATNAVQIVEAMLGEQR
jgi:aspartate-semialdehyde dehydrogenase